MTLLQTQAQLVQSYNARHGTGFAEKLIAGSKATLANIQKLSAGLAATPHRHNPPQLPRPPRPASPARRHRRLDWRN